MWEPGGKTAKKGFLGSRIKWFMIYLMSSCNIGGGRPKRSDERSRATDTGYLSPNFAHRHLRWQSNTNPTVVRHFATIFAEQKPLTRKRHINIQLANVQRFCLPVSSKVRNRPANPIDFNKCDARGVTWMRPVRFVVGVLWPWTTFNSIARLYQERLLMLGVWRIRWRSTGQEAAN